VTVTQPAAVAPRRKELPHPTSPQLFGAAARAEWVKLRSVRSTVWSLLVTVVLTIGLGALFDLARVSRWDRLSAGDRLTFDPTGFSLSGLFLAQLAIGVLGVLVISSEYSTGQIRASLGATPQRRMFLGAKAAVFTAIVFVIGLITCLVAFFIGQAIYSSKHAQASLSDPGVLRAVIGGGMYLAALGLLAIGLGTILRHSAAGIAALVGLLLVLPIMAGFLPSPWDRDVSKLLPGQGSAIFQVVQRSSDNLAAWPGFGVLCAWAAVSLVLGAVLIGRRDA
jgi:ABC-type transport system involved in multi-copper enzyme maturation permease subunit